MEKIRVFTAFSGYDSQCMALDRLKQHHPQFDYELVGWAEIDPHAIKAHNAVYPQYADRNYGDISRIDWSQVPDFDLFTYSSPCQDFSQAGKQAGGEQGSGTRSSLLWECERTIIAKRPKYLLMENVAALVSQKFIRLFNRWQLTLEGYGYTNFARVLNAKDYGVPQNRERIFMVSIHEEGARYEFPKPMPLPIRLKDVLEPQVDERYYLSEKICKGFFEHKSRHATKGNGFAFEPTTGEGIAHGLSTHPNDRATDNFILEPLIGAFRGRNPENPSERGRSNGRYQQRLEINENGWSNTLTGVQKDNVVLEPIHTSNKRVLQIISEQGDKFHDGAFLDCYNQQVLGEIAGTITCGISFRNQWFVVIGDNPYRIRKLTERECFRLMDVPEEYIDRIQAAGISRSQQYKMAGNSIVVACMYHIWRRLFIDTEPTILTLF